MRVAEGLQQCTAIYPGRHHTHTHTHVSWLRLRRRTGGLLHWQQIWIGLTRFRTEPQTSSISVGKRRHTLKHSNPHTSCMATQPTSAWMAQQMVECHRAHRNAWQIGIMRRMRCWCARVFPDTIFANTFLACARLLINILQCGGHKTCWRVLRNSQFGLEFLSRYSCIFSISLRLNILLDTTTDTCSHHVGFHLKWPMTSK